MILQLSSKEPAPTRCLTIGELRVLERYRAALERAVHLLAWTGLRKGRRGPESEPVLPPDHACWPRSDVLSEVGFGPEGQLLFKLGRTRLSRVITFPSKVGFGLERPTTHKVDLKRVALCQLSLYLPLFRNPPAVSELNCGGIPCELTPRLQRVCWHIYCHSSFWREILGSSSLVKRGSLESMPVLLIAS